MTADVLVVGAGLIGTSVGLALLGTRDVVLTDSVDRHVAAATHRGAGRAWDGLEPANLVLVCVPPAATAAVLLALRRRDVGQTYSHVASVQAPVRREIETADRAMKGAIRDVVGSHPMAGRETSGPDGAAADLFVGRPWAVCATPTSGSEHVARVHALVADCGGSLWTTTDEDHDEVVALLSHLPQVVASAVAARLAGAGPDRAALAGPGLLDSTRTAASPGQLWEDVLRLNAGHVAPLLDDLVADLQATAGALRALAAATDARSATDAKAATNAKAATDAGAVTDAGVAIDAGAATDAGGPIDAAATDAPGPPAAAAVVADLLARGRAGRALLPVKRGGRDWDFVRVSVVVPDRPGQLAGLLVAAAAADVNVEDVRVEHLPGRATGVLELLVRRERADHAARALRAAGWDVRGALPAD